MPAPAQAEPAAAEEDEFNEDLEYDDYDDEAFEGLSVPEMDRATVLSALDGAQTGEFGVRTSKKEPNAILISVRRCPPPFPGAPPASCIPLSRVRRVPDGGDGGFESICWLLTASDADNVAEG